MSAYLAGGLIFGGALILGHLAKSRRDAELESAGLLLICGVGVSTGLRLIVVCAKYTSLGPFGQEDRVYIILGGIALIWVSARAILNVFERAGDSA